MDVYHQRDLFVANALWLVDVPAPLHTFMRDAFLRHCHLPCAAKKIQIAGATFAIRRGSNSRVWESESEGRTQECNGGVYAHSDCGSLSKVKPGGGVEIEKRGESVRKEQTN